MIFYFSGTGNSLAAAKKLLMEGEELINMTDCVRQGNCRFHLKEGETVGFVFPVYFLGLPSVVQSFLNHLEFDGVPAYTYGVLTCGGMAADAGSMLEKRLAERSVILDAVYPVVMPDNYVIMYALDDEETQKKILEKADEELESIRDNIREQNNSVILAGPVGRLLTKLLYPMYVHGRKTKNFYTTDDCVGCGLCASRCPYEAIVMENGRPRWVKDRCAQCLACMRCGAVQYNKATVGRARYTHPDLKRKKKQEATCHGDH